MKREVTQEELQVIEVICRLGSMNQFYVPRPDRCNLHHDVIANGEKQLVICTKPKNHEGVHLDL